MPGNEVGDRVHNFFEQGNLSQDQCNTQLVDGGNWPAFSNNLWGGSERQITGSLNSSSKNYTAQQADIERGQGNPFSLGSHGLNFIQSNVRPEFVKNPSQLQQLNLNGYVHSPQVVLTRQNEANFLGVDMERDRYLTSRGMSTLESQQRSDSKHTNLANFGGSESTMNFNFLGGQQQMSGQQSGRSQSLSRLQPSVNDTQLVQQQVLLKQMQELQRQQHLHQFAANHISNFPSQMAGQRSPVINGSPLHNASNNPWASQAMAGNSIWPQLGPSSAVHGYSNGLMITPEQGQTMRFMGLIPQQGSQSLYGVPVSNSRTANPYSQNIIDKPGMLQVQAPGSSFSGNQCGPHQKQVSMLDGPTVSRCGVEGKSSFELVGLGNVVDAGSFNQVQQRNVTMSEGGRQDSADGSELIPEKSVTLPASSPAAVALDPTEERILFGNDESIWDAFGGSSLSGTGGTNRLDATDPFNGVSSMQSGTWSALMQSAVGEASSSDTGMQEELSGLGSQNSRLQSGSRPPSIFQVTEKQPSVWSDGSQKTSRGSPSATNNVHTSYFNNSAISQPFPNQTESQISQEGRKWLDHNPLKSHAVPNQALENTNSSGDYYENDTGFWGLGRNTVLPQKSGQPSSRANALNFIESIPANGCVASTNQIRDNFGSRDMSMDLGRDTAATRFESHTNSNLKMESPPVCSMNDGASSSLSNMKVNHENDQKLPVNDHLDLWKSVNSSLKSNIEGSEKDQHNLSKGPPILESSTKMHDTDSSGHRENLNDSHYTRAPHHAPPGNLRENVWLDTGEQLGMPGGKEKLSAQSGKKPPVSRKFQYHPMGDVDTDVEASYTEKHVLHSQPISQNLSTSVKGQEIRAGFLGSLNANSMDMEKGSVSSFKGAAKMSHGAVSSGILPGHVANVSAPFIRFGESSSPNQHVLSSQNMLELLHKVDQSKEQNAISHLNSSDVASHGPGGLNHSQSTSSHGFNLQLAPPSQGVASPNLLVGSQISSRLADSASSGFSASDKADKAHTWLGSVSSAQCFPPSHLPPQLQSGNSRPGSMGSTEAEAMQNLKGKFSVPFPSAASYLINSFQNQHLTAAGGTMSSDKSPALTFDKRAHQENMFNESRNQASTNQSDNNSHQNLASGKSMYQSGLRTVMQVPPADVIPGMPMKDKLSPLGANVWNSQQHLLGGQGYNDSDMPKSRFLPKSTLDVHFTQEKDDQDGPGKVDASSLQGAVAMDECAATEVRSTGQTVVESCEIDPIMTHPSDASRSTSFASEKDFEPVHDSLKSHNVVNNSYSLLQQIQAMKSTPVDSFNRESKRLKESHDDPDTQQTAGKAGQPFSDSQNNVVRDPSMDQPSVPAGNAKILNFGPQSGSKGTTFQPPLGAVTSQDVLSFGSNDPQRFSPGNLASRFEHTGISPQMAPSWFEQYGTLKNGQLVPVNNVPRIPVNKCAEQQFISGKSPNYLVEHGSVQPVNSTANTGLVADSCQTISAYTPGELGASQDSLVPPVSAPGLASMKPRKRKTDTSDLLPWNKEVGQNIKRIQNMRLAEINWAQSSNRLAEKVEDETDALEDLLPKISQKRRLILTTQLMQQMFQPPSAAVLSLDASSSCEVILYSLARSTLGDACSQVCGLESDQPGNPLSEKAKTSERIRDQYFSKVMHDFNNKTNELRENVVRLDKRGSILDLRLDCQDLERFSVINRFARFHGRSQVDGVETSSSSDATAMAQKPCPLRYVSAHPMPRTVPERVQCLSL